MIYYYMKIKPCWWAFIRKTLRYFSVTFTGHLEERDMKQQVRDRQGKEKGGKEREVATMNETAREPKTIEE